MYILKSRTVTRIPPVQPLSKPRTGKAKFTKHPHGIDSQQVGKGNKEQ